MKEALYNMYMPSISFTDKYLLGTTKHNRPLYVTGYNDGDKINLILINPGSSINIMNLKILKVYQWISSTWQSRKSSLRVSIRIISKP